MTYKNDTMFCLFFFHFTPKIEQWTYFVLSVYILNQFASIDCQVSCTFCFIRRILTISCDFMLLCNSRGRKKSKFLFSWPWSSAIEIVIPIFMPGWSISPKTPFFLSLPSLFSLFGIWFTMSPGSSRISIESAKPESKKSFTIGEKIKVTITG